MKNQAVGIIFDPPFQKPPVWHAAVMEYERLHSFFSGTYQYHCIFFVKLFCHIIQKIKGKAVRVWIIPAFGTQTIEIKTRDFGQDNEAPF